MVPSLALLVVEISVAVAEVVAAPASPGAPTTARAPTASATAAARVRHRKRPDPVAPRVCFMSGISPRHDCPLEVTYGRPGPTDCPPTRIDGNPFAVAARRSGRAG